MKNNRNWLAIFVIGILVLTAYTVPSIMAKWEDERIQSTRKTFEIEEINLNSTEVDCKETLFVLRDLIDEQIYMQEPKIVDENQRDYLAVNDSVRNFMGIFGWNSMEFLKLEVETFVMVDLNTDKIYPLYSLRAVDKNEESYYFWLNAVDVKVIAFDIPMRAEYYVPTEELEDYYGFSTSEISEEVYYEKNYGEIMIYFADENEKPENSVIFSLCGDRISFNLYPGELSIYDTKMDAYGAY